MPDLDPFAIRAEHVSKSYRISHEARQDTLRDAVFTRMRGLLAGGFRLRASPDEEFWALDEVSFELERGEVLGIVGRNGAGKSTLLKILSRITEPTRGRVLMRGRVASLLEVGTGFHPELTGRENIFLNGGILGMSRAEIRSRFDAIVEFSGVSRFLDTPVKRYSSGMYVRLAFAVAAHLEPEILIIDEVLAVGDAEFQKKCLGKMGEVAGHGRTVLFVSHNLSAVRALCTKALLMDQGRCLRVGPVAAVLADYVQPVAGGQVAYAGGAAGAMPSVESARLLTSSGGAQHEVERPLVLEVTLRPAGTEGLCLSLHVHDSRFEQAVHSSSEFGAGACGAGLPATTVRATLPPRLLNVGEYRVTLVLAKRNAALFERLEGVLSFVVVDSDFAVAGTQPGEWSGSSSPRAVAWEWTR
jgi:lipopolysaccharide transport system ATP-binding protein